MSDLEIVMDEAGPTLGAAGATPLAIRDVASGLPALPDANIGTVVLTREEREILDAPAELERFAVRPDPLANGEPVVYLPHEWYRDRLREALGFGAFALKPLKVWGEEVKQRDGSMATLIYFWGALYVRGSFVADSIGSALYHPKSARQDLSDTVKAARSNAFVRCCSDGGLGTEPWQPAFCAYFAAEHCVKVMITEDGKPKPKWRLKSAKPFDDERIITSSTADSSKTLMAGARLDGEELREKSGGKSSAASSTDKAEDRPSANQAGGEGELTLDLDAVSEREPASDEQVAKLKTLTAKLNPKAVEAALKQRRVKGFEELSAKQAQNIIKTLEGATA